MERRLYLVTVLAVIIGIALSCALYGLFYRLETTNIKREFERDVESKAAALIQAVELNIEAIYSLKAAYDNHGLLDYPDFSQLAAQTLSRHAHIQALEWIPKVEAEGLPALEKQFGARWPGFHVTERVASGEMVPVSERSLYYPVIYVEPLQGNERALGFDVGSNGRRLDALNRARDSGKLQFSERIELVQTTDDHAGLLMLLPVYHIVSPQSVADRRQTLRGFVMGVFRLTAILQSTMQPQDASLMAFRLLDVNADPHNQLLYQQGSLTTEEQLAQKDFNVTRPVLTLGGREWFIEATPSASYVADKRTRLPLVVFIVGTVLFGLVIFYGFILMRRNREMVSTLAKKNQALDDINKKLERMTKMDVLVGIANRRYFDETLHREFSRSRREDRPLALMLIDIDHFKAFNDTYGHQAGDRCLKLVAEELGRVLKRPADMLARVGGEEFGIILPNTNNGEVVAKQCRSVVERLAIAHQGSLTSDVVTVSVGVVSLESLDAQTRDSVFNLADSALYQAKSAGRNQVRAIRVGRPQSASVSSLC